MPVAAEVGDRRQLTVAELEVEEVDALANSRWRNRLGDNDVAKLELPAQHHLGGCLGVALGEPRDHRIGKQLVLPERAPGLGDDAAGGVEGAELRLLKARVQLDLIDRWSDPPLAPAARAPRC